MNVSSTSNAVACNCTGVYRPPNQGGKGQCPLLGPAVPLPVCNLCGEPWAAGHDCTAARQATPLGDRWQREQDAMDRCPCRVENGGSGICGCARFGQVIC